MATTAPVSKPAVSEDMFALLKHDWVWDFFFDSGETELDMLQYAFAKDTLLTVDFDLSTVEHMEMYSNVFNLCEKQKFLFLPSFTTGAISVGFAVSRVQRSSQTIVSKEIYMGRIARDDDNGNCLFISEQFNDNVTEVSYMSMLTSSCRETRYNLFRKKPFREAMERFKAFSFEEHAFREAVIFSYHSFDARPCPNCGGSRSAACSCKLQLERKRHPRDDEREMKNMVSYTGGFEGFACVQIFEKGVQLFQGNFICTANLRHTFDCESQRKLGLWAIRNAATSRKINPLALMMKSCATQKVSTSDTLLLASLADSAASANTIGSGALSSSVASVLSNSPVGRIVAASIKATTNLSESSTLLEPPESPPEKNNGVELGAETAKTVPLVKSGPIVMQLENDQDEIFSESNSAVTSQGVESEQKTEENDDLQQVSILGTLPESAVETRSDVRVQRPVLLAPAIAMAPVPVTSAPSGAIAAVVESAEDAELAMRRRRAELRRERNRESAQRSNLKRKLRMQKLKDEIAEMSSRAMYLRAREKILREENVSLKMTLSR